MRKFLIPLSVAMMLAAAGCTNLLSLNPWVEGEGLVDPQLAGTWTDKDGGDVFVIQTVEGDKYNVVYAPADGQAQRFKGKLFAVAGARFLDLSPTKADALFVWPAHALVKVWFEGEDLSFAFVDSEWFHKQAENSVVPMQQIDDVILLTAPTSTLKSQLLAHAADQQAISTGERSGAGRLHRVK